MKILVALAVFFLVSTQLFAEEIGANDDLNYWSDWSDSDQIKKLVGYRSWGARLGKTVKVICKALSPFPTGAPAPDPTHLCAFRAEELPEPFEHLLQRIARRPKPQQFFGLMGKRDADSSIEKQVALLKALYGHGQISHKRHKTDSFVGLMGKRALNSVAYERSAMQNYERRR
ncbi:protachykinin-1 isoform X1 [Pongo pygmaeus]|uniref:protachykinin-1 isoform X1 n=1 Tax=Pongo pygmaeus TaxID=9600 RepID=UPI00300C3E9D